MHFFWIDIKYDHPFLFPRLRANTDYPKSLFFLSLTMLHRRQLRSIEYCYKIFYNHTLPLFSMVATESGSSFVSDAVQFIRVSEYLFEKKCY